MRDQSTTTGGIVRPMLLSLMLLAFATSAPADESFPLYFEWGPPLHDFLDLGGAEIDPYQDCNNASGGLVVGGFDTVGEWIEILFTLPEAGRFDPEASFRSADGQYNSFTLSLRPAAGGDPWSIEIDYHGAGTG
jgi:hypothetical protein